MSEPDTKDDAKAVEKESATDTPPEQGEQPQAGEKKVGPWWCCSVVLCLLSFNPSHLG